MHLMNPQEILSLEQGIKRFLAEYQAVFFSTRYSSMGRELDSKYVVRFIDQVRKLYRKEQEFFNNTNTEIGGHTIDDRQVLSAQNLPAGEDPYLVKPSMLKS